MKKITTASEVIRAMSTDKAVRKAIVKRLHKFFLHLYFKHYLEYDPAPFHEELLRMSEDKSLSMVVVSGFRNCGKSTILSLSYPIWAIIGTMQEKFVLIVSENEMKSQILLGHIKNELENNELLKRDLGPFNEKNYTWNATSLTMNNYGARIMAISTGQSLRGMRYLNHRPGLIIIDDSESLDSVKTVESRDKLERWLTSDVIPAGHAKTKIVVIGSILHPDGLIKRLHKKIDEKKINGAYGVFPIIDNYGNSLWPARFPDEASIEREKARGIPDREWKVEYMCEPVSDDYQIIKNEWIKYHDHLPDRVELKYRYAITGVDPAISKEARADYTAMVSGIVTRTDDDWSVYIVPHPINEHLDGPEIQERILQQSQLLGNGNFTDVAIEDVGFQQLIIDMMRQKGINTEGISPGGNDKRARLISISELIRSGKILFPKHGAEKLIQQLTGFEMEKHDDLVDALVILVTAIMRREKQCSLTVPNHDQPKVITLKEAEKEADIERGLCNRMLRGDPIAGRKYNEMMSRKNKEHWRVEELEVFNKMMRGY